MRLLGLRIGAESARAATPATTGLCTSLSKSADRGATDSKRFSPNAIQFSDPRSSGPPGGACGALVRGAFVYTMNDRAKAHFERYRQITTLALRIEAALPGTTDWCCVL